jgi:hypothetical protein
VKVALLNDLPVAGVLTSGFGSGAELSSGRFLYEGHRRSHIVDVVTPEYCSNGVLDEYDLLVVKNIVKFSGEQIANIRRRRYVCWPSDYSFYRWRLYFAFQDEIRGRPETRAWEDFFTGSVFNAFLSPLHQDVYAWALPKTATHPAVLSPPAVNVDLFQPSPEGWVPDTAVGINSLLDFKALHTSLTWCEENPNVKVTFIGGSRDNVNLPKNAVFVGPKSQREIAKILGRTETFIELPKTPQPANRSAVEGLLACKRVVFNDLVGFGSYDWFQRADRVAARAACKDAPRLLWERIEKEVPV